MGIAKRDGEWCAEVIGRYLATSTSQPCAKMPDVDAAEGVEELGEVGDQVEADDPLEDRGRDPGAPPRDLGRRVRSGG